MDRGWQTFILLSAIILIGILIALVILLRPFPQIFVLPPTTPTTTPTSTPTPISTPISSSTQTPTSTSTPTPTLSPRTSDLIIVTSPTPNQLITSPLRITGEARGNWFFEASAPVELLDGNGQRITQGIITAQGDWMTTNFVPFTGTINFSAPSTNTGQLVLQNDNPSGLPENNRQTTIPVRFR